jgi:hypothetical protein
VECDLVANFSEGTLSAEITIKIIQRGGTVGIEQWDVFVMERPISLYPFSEKLPCLVELANENTQDDAGLPGFDFFRDPGGWCILPHHQDQFREHVNFVAGVP